MNTKLGHIVATALLAASTMTMGASTAVAQNLQYGNYLPPSHPTNAYALTPLFDAVREESDGKLNVILQAGGALVGVKDTLSGIATGLVDGGFIVSIFVPNEIPLNTTLSDLAMLIEDPVTMVGALNETVLLDCPACLEEYQDHNVTYLGAHSTTAYSLMCQEPVKTLSDIQGLKIRSSSDVYGRWLNEIGGVPVSVSVSEAYEAMQRGLLDCVYGSVGWLKSMSLWDVSKHVLRQESGGFGGGALIAFNTDTWDGMSDESRSMIVDRVPGALARLAVGYITEDEAAVQEASERGVMVNGKDPEISALLAEYQKSEVELAVAKAGERGAEGAQQLVDAYIENLKKWKKISAETGGDVTLIEEALRREIYSKLDL